MARTSAAVIENNFVGGLKTEYTGLNFPENSATETYDCIFSKIGRVTRRKGFDIEDSGVYSTLNRSQVVVNSYLWQNVGGDGRVILLVLQVGTTLRFYEVSDTSTVLSNQLLATTVDLTTFIPAGSTPTPGITECQFAQGNGYLFVFHKDLQPFYITYDASLQTVTATSITIQIRDLGGIVEANVPVTQRPGTLTTSHRYNLGNQGWKSGYNLTSTTSTLMATGSKAFTVNVTAASTPVNVGDIVKVFSTAATTNFMFGTVTAYSGTTLTVLVSAINGAGTFADWNVVAYPDDISTWHDAAANYPSNADIWWYFKNASDVFDPANTIKNVPVVNTPAPKGHYIVDAFNIDRSVVSGIPGFTALSTGGARPSAGTFFQGRVFYSGLNYNQYNSNIYFSQIIENTAEQFGSCYQLNDPTSELLFDPLPSDGGVISIQGVGAIIKLIPLKTALMVFATNGIWAITGNQGIGFTATDYTVARISSMKLLFSPTSYVEVQEAITWWAQDGIYTLQVGAQGISINNTTNTTIAEFYDNIPNTSKLNVRGYYNPVSFIVQWLYRSTEATSVSERYEFDRILNFNTVTSAFYPWIVSGAALTINGVVVVESPGGNLTIENVVDGSGNQVVDGSANNVIRYAISENVSPIFKYIISKSHSGTSYDFSFGEAFKNTYLDWGSLGVGITYDSYFITGFAVHGQAQRFFQSNYVYVYSDFDDDELTSNSYDLQGIWNYANSESSHRFTTVQSVSQTKAFLNVIKRRFKIRGRGLALQLKFTSTEGSPFSLIGWSKFETSNAGI